MNEHTCKTVSVVLRIYLCVWLQLKQKASQPFHHDDDDEHFHWQSETYKKALL